MRQREGSICAIVALVLVALGSTEARAQAWVGYKGSLDLGLDYNLGISSKVVADDDEEFPDTGTTSHQITVGAEYVPVSNLAVNVSLPVSMLKYNGFLDPMGNTMFPHAGGGTYDDGEMHTTLTDLRAGVRYQVLDEPIALSPHIAVSIPVADYETIGNTVGGRHLKGLHVGLGLGKIIGESTYVHLFYEFTLREKYDRTADTGKYSQNRSDLAFTIGHKLLSQRLDIHLDANLGESHDGLNFSELPAWTPDELLYHDAVLDEDVVLVGGGLGFQLAESLAMNVSARMFVTGANTQNASVFALGLAWSPL